VTLDFGKLWGKLVGLIIYRRRFLRFGNGSFFVSPLRIVNPRYISIGKNVRVRHHLRIEALDHLGPPELSIGDDCNIEQGVHIICSGKVEIGKSCSITARCAIVDTDHPFDGPEGLKIGEQLNKTAKYVKIGDGCFIGIGAVILPNVVLGNRCVVGANSVVTAGIYPEFSVIAGSPARVLRTISRSH
jgi:acetyltransferase-like isoleucine patch superfamily enzyme